MAHDLYSALAADSIAGRAASTALHRLVRSGKVRRLNLRLRHGRAIVFSPEAPADATFVRRLSDTEFGGAPGPARTLRALASSSGVMSAADAAKLAGLEVGLDPTISLKDAHDLMRDLEQLGIVSSIGPLGAQLLWRANDVLLRDAEVLTGPPRPQGHYGAVSHLLGHTVARQVADWLFQNGWTSKLGTLCADKENPGRSGAGMAFGVVAFSHLPAIRATADKARVILGEVSVRAFAEVDGEAYLHRFGRARARFKHYPLCFVLARSFQADAHARLKRASSRGRTRSSSTRSSPRPSARPLSWPKRSRAAPSWIRVHSKQRWQGRRTTGRSSARSAAASSRSSSASSCTSWVERA